MIKLLKFAVYSTVVIGAFFSGVYSQQLLQIPTEPTNLADTTSAIAALAGLIIAAITITNWKKTKIQEDSYQLIKNYISELVLIETTITEIFIEIRSITPLAGNAVPSQAFVTETLQNIDQLRKKLSKLYRQIYQTKNELSFWGTELTQRPESTYKKLMDELYNFQIVSDVIRNNLESFFSNSLCSTTQITTEYEKLECYFKKISIILLERKATKMSDMFIISH